MVSNYFNVYGFSHVTSNRSPVRLWIVWSMYIRIHVESKADTMFRWFESMVYEETSSAWHCGVNVLRDPCLCACSAWHCGVIAFRQETCSAWHCGVIAFRQETCSAWHCGVHCLYLHVFYGIPSLWLHSNRLLNVQFNSRCTLLHQTICHALADYVLMFSRTQCTVHVLSSIR